MILGIFRNLQVFLILISLLALSLAYISQYVFGLEPCILCLYQRVPYFIAIFIGVTSFFVKGRARLFLVTLIGLSYLSGAGVAFYHTGVENGVFKMQQECGDSGEIEGSIEAMRQKLLGKTHVPCDKPQFVFLGFSMAAWNFFFSILVASYTLQICWKNFRSLRWEKISNDYRKENK